MSTRGVAAGFRPWRSNRESRHKYFEKRHHVLFTIRDAGAHAPRCAVPLGGRRSARVLRRANIAPPANGPMETHEKSV